MPAACRLTVQEMAAALRFAAAFEDLQGQLMSLIWELHGKPTAACQMCAALVAGAIAPSLPLSLVSRFPCYDLHCPPICLAGNTALTDDGFRLIARFSLPC